MACLSAVCLSELPKSLRLVEAVAAESTAYRAREGHRLQATARTFGSSSWHCCNAALVALHFSQRCRRQLDRDKVPERFPTFGFRILCYPHCSNMCSSVDAVQYGHRAIEIGLHTYQRVVLLRQPLCLAASLAPATGRWLARSAFRVDQ